MLMKKGTPRSAAEASVDAFLKAHPRALKAGLECVPQVEPEKVTLAFGEADVCALCVQAPSGTRSVKAASSLQEGSRTSADIVPRRSSRDRCRPGCIRLRDVSMLELLLALLVSRKTRACCLQPH